MNPKPPASAKSAAPAHTEAFLLAARIRSLFVSEHAPIETVETILQGWQKQTAAERDTLRGINAELVDMLYMWRSWIGTGQLNFRADHLAEADALLTKAKGQP